ncbi:MAG: DUF3052 domain-containing protein [Chloroflexia bacterium]
MSTGYSKRTLAEKLGLKAGQRVALLNAPAGYFEALGEVVGGAELVEVGPGGVDFIQVFTNSRLELADRFPELKRGLASAGMLWVSWPKGSSRVASDLNENVVREIGLENGLVDVKVISVDEVWSGLKFVYRVKDR